MANRSDRKRSGSQKSKKDRGFSKPVIAAALSMFGTCAIAVIKLRDARLDLIVIALATLIFAGILVTYILKESPPAISPRTILVLFVIVMLLISCVAAWLAVTTSRGVPWPDLISTAMNLQGSGTLRILLGILLGSIMASICSTLTRISSNAQQERRKTNPLLCLQRDVVNTDGRIDPGEASRAANPCVLWPGLGFQNANTRDLGVDLSILCVAVRAA